MKYCLFGKSGLRVSELSLGTMTFGEDWGWGADKETKTEESKIDPAEFAKPYVVGKGF